jgi:hypothetical protein
MLIIAKKEKNAKEFTKLTKSQKKFSLDHYSVSEELKLSYGKNQKKNVKTLSPTDKK